MDEETEPRRKSLTYPESHTIDKVRTQSCFGPCKGKENQPQSQKMGILVRGEQGWERNPRIKSCSLRMFIILSHSLLLDSLEEKHRFTPITSSLHLVLLSRT